MEFVPALGVAECELRFTVAAQKVENLLYFYLGAAAVDSDFVDLGDALVTWWTAEMAPRTNPGMVLREVYITDLSGPTAPTYTTPAGEAGVPGTNISELMPNNVALCLSFRTAGRGRSSRGRNYICGLSNNQITGSSIGSDAAADIVGAYAELLAGTYTGTAEWIVLSRVSGGAPRTEGLRQLITAVLVTDLSLDSQRRRLPGRGA